MSNSSLATYIDKGSGKYNSRTSEISKITIHSAACTGECNSLSELINSSKEASYNYGIGNNGNIALFVDERFRSWSTGSPTNDNCSVNIIVANSSENSQLPISEKAMESLIMLITDICRRNFIPKLVYTGRFETSNVTLHRWFKSGVNCPGPYIEGKLSYICDRVNSQLNSSVIASSLEESYKASNSIVASAINPYIVTVDKTLSDIDFVSLRLAGVVGSMIPCGRLYDSSKPNHKELANYVYPNVAVQSSMSEKAGLPFGLIWECNATTEEEAKNECYYLYFIVSKFPPKLGVWIRLSFDKTPKAVNDTILGTYYSKLYDWGLHDKCGIQCTREQLSKISWEQHSSKMSLWIIDHIQSMQNLPDLLTPQFFK